MFNIGAGEFLVILVIALVVLGPERLPEAIRKMGQVMGELRKLSSGFQDELREALNEPLQEMRSTVDMVRNPFTEGEETPAPSVTQPIGETLVDPMAGDNPAPAPDVVEPPSGSSPLSS